MQWSRDEKRIRGKSVLTPARGGKEECVLVFICADRRSPDKFQICRHFCLISYNFNDFKMGTVQQISVQKKERHS